MRQSAGPSTGETIYLLQNWTFLVVANIAVADASNSLSCNRFSQAVHFSLNGGFIGIEYRLCTGFVGKGQACD